MTNFTIGPTVVTFVANQDTFNERQDRALRVWQIEAYLTLPTDYTNLYSLRSWLVTKTPLPGGNTIFADIGGGAGAGTLTLDFVVGSPFKAVLSAISRPSAYPGGGRKAQCTFEEVP